MEGGQPPYSPILDHLCDILRGLVSRYISNTHWQSNFNLGTEKL